MKMLDASSVARVWSSNTEVIGAGFLIGSDQVLTCAHVLAGLSRNQGWESPIGEIKLDFPIIRSGPFVARTTHWVPPSSEGGGDLAVLKLQSDAPQAAKVVQLSAVRELWGHPFGVLGFPVGHSDGAYASGRILGRIASGWLQIEDVKQTGHFVQKGFSGAPVWDEQINQIVGMVVAVDLQPNNRVAFIIPSDMIRESIPWLQLTKTESPFPEIISDEFRQYEVGLRRLFERIKPDHPKYVQALAYKQSLQENIAQARFYGSDKALKAERIAIITQLNILALGALGASFGDLCEE